MKADNARVIVGLDLHSVKVRLYISRWRGVEEVPRTGRTIVTTREALVATYRQNVPKDSVTVVEATSGAFALTRELRALGYGAKTVNSDVLRCFERGDHVNDEIDARNLAKAEAAHLTREVFVPSAEYEGHRTLFLKYQNAVAECTRTSNHVWAICSELNLPLPSGRGAGRAGAVRRMMKNHTLTTVHRAIVEEDLSACDEAAARKARIMERIVEIISGNEKMMRAMQIVGVGPVTAFALLAYIEDVGRFDGAKKLVAYVGLNPVVCESGKSSSPRKLTRYGRRALRSLLVEGAQSAMTNGGGAMHAWARRKFMQGKDRNVVICALARKMLVQAWHILKGHPAPDRMGEAGYETKLVKLASARGRKAIAAEGYANRRAFAEAMAEKVYAHLPPLTPEEEAKIGRRREKTRRQSAACAKKAKAKSK